MKYFSRVKYDVPVYRSMMQMPLLRKHNAESGVASLLVTGGFAAQNNVQP